MTKDLKVKAQQPEALAELARSARETTSDESDRSLTAIAQNKPLPTQNASKHEVAETLLSAGAEGKKPDPRRAGIHKLPDRTRVKR
jgi:hypothetical protein